MLCFYDTLSLLFFLVTFPIYNSRFCIVDRTLCSLPVVSISFILSTRPYTLHDFYFLFQFTNNYFTCSSKLNMVKSKRNKRRNSKVRPQAWNFQQCLSFSVYRTPRYEINYWYSKFCFWEEGRTWSHEKANWRYQEGDWLADTKTFQTSKYITGIKYAYDFANILNFRIYFRMVKPSGAHKKISRYD